jgi:alpha-beta hydrolase superfamily lysophospholipase
MTDYSAPEGLRTRGTVLVVPGRGETRRSYARFGARLAADAYQVRVLTAVDSVEALADELTASVSGRVDPLVLIGSDRGAALVAALVAREQTTAPWWPAAVVLAGLPGYGVHTSDAWEDELDGRTHCPTHRGVLTDDGEVGRGALNSALPSALLDAAYGSTVDLPHLLVVGDADPYADRAALSRVTKALPRARLAVVRDGHHDVLNDLQHRSVAAAIVTFLEALRDDASLVPIVTLEPGTW